MTSSTIPQGGKVVSSMTFPIVEVTPETAAKWLTFNKVNRPLRMTKVEAYANMMRQGKWRTDREPIEFGQEDGQFILRNGQHRLHALIKNGEPIQFPIRGDVPSEDMAIMDTGLSRQASDVLAMRGVKYATIVAAATKNLYLWREYPSVTMLRAGATRVNNEILDEYERKNPQILESTKFVTKHTRTGAGGAFRLVPPAALAAFHAEAKLKHGKKADEFIVKLTEGFGLEEGDAIVALRKLLINTQSKAAITPTEMKLAWTVHAFNKWMRGEKNVQIIKHTKTMDYPTIA